jgi:hypothetical protein
MTLEFKKYKSRFTNEQILAVHFSGKETQFLEILDWVLDNGGQARGEPRFDGKLDLQIFEVGTGMVTVNPGEWVIKTDSQFEIHPIATFTQMYQKVDPVMQVIKKPEVMGAMQFTGDIENENELEEWLRMHGHRGTFRHSIPGTTITYYRIEVSDGMGSIDIPLNDWVLIYGGNLIWMPNKDFIEKYQRVN